MNAFNNGTGKSIGSKKLFLFEIFVNQNMEEGSIPVALTPSAAHEFDRKDIEYFIPEDFLTESELLALYRQGHRESELDKFKIKLAESINDHYNKSHKQKIDMGFLLFREFSFLFDTVYSKSYLTEKIIEKTKPSSITLLTDKSYPLQLKEIDTFSERNSLANITYFILKEICSHTGIEFNVLRSTETSRLRRHKRVRGGWVVEKKRTILRRTCRRLIIILSIEMNNLLCFKKNSVLFYTLDVGAEKWIKDFLRGKKHKVFIFLKDNSRLKIFSKLINKNLLTSSPSYPESSDKFDYKETVLELNSLCNVKVNELLEPFMDVIISRWIPTIYYYFTQWESIIKKRNVKYIVLTSASTLKDMSLISAAKNSKTSKSILVSHGDNIFDNPNYDYGGVPIYFSDYFFASNAERASYYKEIVASLGIETKVALNSDRLRSSIIKRRKKHGRTKVLYIPGFFMVNKLRIDGAEYTANWYYKFQRGLIKFFSELEDYDFIWKGTVNLNDVFYPSPIKYFIEESKFNNVFARIDSFLENLKECDLFFTDLPSTTFYEAIVNGFPVLGAYREGLKPREEVLKLSGKSLVRFKELDDLKPHIIEFLTSDPELYRVNLQLENKSLYDSLITQK